MALKLNFHHWLAAVLPAIFFLLVLDALFDLFRREVGLSPSWGTAVLGGGCGVIAAWAWYRAGSHFCTMRDALIRIETRLVLHNRLSSAEDGVLPWPKPLEGFEDGYSANWKQIAVPLVGGLVFLGCSHLIPVLPMKTAASSQAISEPPEFAQVQSWINALKADDLIEPQKLQEVQSALDKLRERPAQDWYSQNTLEAANSLEELTEQSMNSLSRDLDKADDTLGAMKEQKESSSDASGLAPMQDELQATSESLASGSLPLKRELVSQLKDAASTDKALSASQLASLQERLKKGELAARTAPQSNGALSDEMQKAMAEAALGHGGERRELVPGAGGLGGGEKTAPLELHPRDKTTPQGPLTPVGTDDMTHVALGDTVKISASQHEVNPADYKGVQNAGDAQVGGSGGEAVWRSTYDPQEADALARFFH